MTEEKFVSLSSMEKLMRKAGAPRVSDEAKEELRDVLEKIGLGIAREANRLSEHANRRTIKARDIKLAVEKRI